MLRIQKYYNMTLEPALGKAITKLREIILSTDPQIGERINRPEDAAYSYSDLKFLTGLLHAALNE